MISGVGTGWQSSNEHRRGSIMLDHCQRGGDLTNHIPIVNAYRLFLRLLIYQRHYVP